MTTTSASCVPVPADGRSHGTSRAAVGPSRSFVAVATLAFAASTAITVAWCGSMSAMDGMSMPGGWTMSMAWMRMPGGTWLGAGASFAGMWAVMMIAMMLPSVAPMLWRCREAVGSREVGGGRRMTLVAAGYFAVWTALGIVVYPLGVGFADFAMRSDSVARVVPIADALVVAMAGLVQLTAWKARALACCRMVPGPPHAHSPWRLGLRLGIRCVSCCAGPTAVLLVLGVMDLRAMAAVTAAIGAERLAPAGERVARATGFVAVAASVLAMAGRMLW